MGAHKKQRIFSILAILTMAVILACIFTACGDTGAQDSGKKELSGSDIYAQVNPSVVFILIQTKSGYSSGSGFFIDSNGTCVTNQHVIEDGLSGAIQLHDGTTATIDSVVGFDKDLDIAILSTSAKNTMPVKISKTPVQVGDTVYAIGYPEAFKLGFSSSTFTSGMVSMNRSIDGYTYIQSTVNITHGNSGGALINKYGEVVGITTGGITYSNIDYMNLSIPIQRLDNVSRTTNEPLSVVTKRNYPVYATFYSDGTKYITQTLRYEGCAYTPTAPTKAGYTFAGWYADSSLKTKYDFSQKLTSNVAIYAKWTINTYRINYNLNSGSWNGSTPSSEYTINNCGNSLPRPKRSGFIFEGWKDASGSFIYNLPSSSDLKNLSLSASWVEGSEGLTFTTHHSGTIYVSVSGYGGNSVNVVIPKMFRGIPVTTIDSSAFKNQTQIKSVTLPVSLTTISSNAFAGCTGLTGMVIPDRVTNIDSTAFSGCTNIVSATMPATIVNRFPNVKNVTISSGTSIQSNAFANCTSLVEIILSSSIITIGDGAFSGCSNLKTINIPTNATSIGNNSFYNCSSLLNIVIPNGVTNISSSSFSGCTNLQSATVPTTCIFALPKNNLKNVYINGGDSIPASAFANCSSLQSIFISNSVVLIGENAFKNCSNITEIAIPKNVNAIGSGAFLGCNKLESITVSVDNQSFSGIGNCIVDKKNHKLVFGCKNSTIPSDGSVKCIGESAINSERDFRKTQQKIPNKIENSLQMIA